MFLAACTRHVSRAPSRRPALPGTRQPKACKNDYLVKSAAKTVYDVESCAQVAMARAEHMNEEDKVEMEKRLR